MLINKCFNIGSHITTIYGINISKCQEYNRLYKLEHYKKWYGTVRQILRPTHPDLKLWKKNYASIHSNMLTISGNTDSIMISTTRKFKSSEKSEQTQFAQLWIVIKHDFKNSQHFFTECQKEQAS